MLVSLYTFSMAEHARDSLQSKFYLDRCLKYTRAKLSLPRAAWKYRKFRFSGFVWSNKYCSETVPWGWGPQGLRGLEDVSHEKINYFWFCFLLQRGKKTGGNCECHCMLIRLTKESQTQLGPRFTRDLSSFQLFGWWTCIRLSDTSHVFLVCFGLDFRLSDSAGTGQRFRNQGGAGNLPQEPRRSRQTGKRRTCKGK